MSSADTDAATYERNVVPRIMMRLTNYQANEAYYPHSLSILRLRRPRVVAEDSALVRELRSLLPVGRQPSATTKGQRLMTIGRQIDAAEQSGNVAEVARLNGLLANLLTHTESPQPEKAADTALAGPEDVIRSIEESLAVLTEVTTESMESVVGRAGVDSSARIELARTALAVVGLSEIRLVRDLPIINAAFGYTRRHFEPTYEELHVPGIPTTVRAFYPLDRSAAQRLGRIELEGTTPVLAREGEHEGLFFALKPETVYRWLGLEHPSRVALLSGLEEVDRYHDEIWSLPRRRLLFGVLHTLSHVVMRSLSRLAGLERTSLGEYLFTPIPGFVVYANAGTFNLGVMEVVLRDHVLALLEDIADSSVRCVHDPDCIEKRGACVGCIHAPEVVCRVFNHGLSRALLTGGHAPWSDIGSRERVEGYWSAALK